MTIEIHPPAIPFEKIVDALRSTTLPPTDLVVGIGSGGVVFAAMVAYKLKVPMMVLWLNYRGANHVPRYPAPQLRQAFSLPPETKSVLLVDDVVVSGKTLKVAKNILVHTEVTTLALKGNADIVLFPDIKTCVQWPWNPSKSTD